MKLKTKNSRTKKIVAIIGATILAASVFATSASADSVDYRLNISTSVPQKSGPSATKRPQAWDNDDAKITIKTYYYKYNDASKQNFDINFSVKDKNYNTATSTFDYLKQYGVGSRFDLSYLPGYGQFGEAYRIYGQLVGNLNIYNEVTSTGIFEP